MNKKPIFRKCIVTNKIINIDDAIRIVKNKNNYFHLEKEVKLEGRGAYILNDFEKINFAFEKKLLNKIFKINIPNSVYDELKNEVKNYDKIKNQKQ